MHVHVSFISFVSSSFLSLLLLPPPARHCIPQDLCVSFTLFSLNYSLCYVFRFSDILQILKNYSLRFIYYILLLDVSFFRTIGVIQVKHNKSNWSEGMFGIGPSSALSTKTVSYAGLQLYQVPQLSYSYFPRLPGAILVNSTVASLDWVLKH